MAIIRLDNEDIEKLVIGYELRDSKYFRKFDLDWFVYADSKKVQGVLNEFFEKFSTYPTVENIRQFTQDPTVTFFVLTVANLNINADDGAFKLAVEELFNMYVNRKLLDQAESIVDGLTKNNDGKDLAKKAIIALSEMRNPHSFGETQRGFAHTVLRQEWDRYRAREQNPTKFNTGIPYGIYMLDRYTAGGTRPGHITLIYGDTSSGKTRFKANIAFNMAMMGKRVMYLSIEDSFDTIVRLWASRAALLDSQDIELAKLDKENRESYRAMLEKLTKEKKLPYIAYWPGEGNVPMLRKEVQLYEAKTGQLPEVIFIDYSNEMFPTREYNNTSERFNYLFSEYRAYFAENRMALVTSLQQSRTGKQKKKEEDYGLDDIGQSHYVAPHCHVVIFIRQSPEDRDLNILKAYLQKNRYGKKDEIIPLTALWNISFVGDRNRLVQHGDYLTQLLQEQFDDANDSKYQNAPINHPFSPSMEDGEEVQDMLDEGNSEETTPEM